MADFTSAQAQLAAARTAQQSAQIAALQAAARARQAQAALDLATRQVRSAGDQNQQLAQLAAAAQRALADQTAATQKLQGARSVVSQATAGFAQFSTPQQNVGQLNDASPFLLLPVRIETRFRSTSQSGQRTPGAAAPQHELLVRIYPDDCSIDTFEPMLSQLRAHQYQGVLDEHLARRRCRERSTRRMEQLWFRRRGPAAPAGWLTTSSQST